MGLEGLFERQKRGAIALFNPPSPFLLDERVFPPLCLADIGGVLEAHGFSIDLYDLAVDSEHPKDWRAEVLRAARKNYVGFGITATSPQFPDACEILKLIRDVKSDSHVVIGGAHPSLMTQLRRYKIAEFTSADSSLSADPARLNQMLYEFDLNFKPLEKFSVIFEGEGENRVHDVMDPMSASRVLSGSKWFSGGIVLKEDMPKLGIPARHLFNIETYNYSIRDVAGTSLRCMNVMSQRGCPFGCEFCSGRLGDMYKIVRSKTSDQIIRELRHMRKIHGADAFMFFDDEFNLNTERTIELCNAMIQLRETEGIGYSWRAFIKSELLVKKPEIAEYMKRAGCVEVCTGVESGSPFILKHVIHKNTSPAINLAARKIARDAGLRYKAFTMVGHAGETEADAMQTLEWILEAKPDDFDVTVCTPYPGAPIYDRATKIKDDLFVYDDSIDKKTKERKKDPITGKERAVRLYFRKPDYSQVQAFYKGVPGEYKSLVWTDDLSPEKIVQLREHIDNTARERLGIAKLVRPSGIDQSMGAPPAYLFAK